MCCQSRTKPAAAASLVLSRALQAARIVLGKFEVILREECMSTDISLLMPYLEAVDEAAEKSRYAHRKQPVNALNATRQSFLAILHTRVQPTTAVAPRGWALVEGARRGVTPTYLATSVQHATTSDPPFSAPQTTVSESTPNQFLLSRCFFLLSQHFEHPAPRVVPPCVPYACLAGTHWVSLSRRSFRCLQDRQGNASFELIGGTCR